MTLNNVMEILVGDVAIVENEPQSEIVQREDGSWLVDGNIPIERFREAMKLDYKIPGEDIQAYLPGAGRFYNVVPGARATYRRSIRSADLRYEVVDMNQNRLDKLHSLQDRS